MGCPGSWALGSAEDWSRSGQWWRSRVAASSWSASPTSRRGRRSPSIASRCTGQNEATWPWSRAAGGERRSSACSGRRAGSRPCSRVSWSSAARGWQLEPCRPGGADRRGSRRSPRPDDVHDRPRHGEGLRRRDLGGARAGRRPCLGAHRRRLGVRPGRLGARSRGGRQGVLDLRARPGRADAPARALGRHVLPAAARRPVVRDRRVRPERRAALLPLDDPQRRPADLRPGAAPRRSGRGFGGARARRRVLCRAAPTAVRPRGAAGRAARDRIRLRRRGRRRSCPMGRRAGGTCARRGADDHRERGGGRAARRPQPGGAVPRSRTARSAIRVSPRRQAGRPRRADPAGAGSTDGRRRRPRRGRRERTRDRLRRPVRPWARGVPGARTPLAQAGPLRPAQPRSLRPREPGLLPFHEPDPPLPGPGRPPRAPPRARRLRRAAARAPGRPGRAHLRPGARGGRAGVPRRRHLPRLAARVAALRPRLERARGRGRSPA